MKAFVVKNKEGKYYKRGFCCWENIERDGVFNTGHFYYDNKEEAESCIVCYNLENCKVAEGDLEQQLAEKDKEIERLKYQLLYSQLQTPKEEIDKFNMAMAIQSLDYTSQIRHKVCDEIRKLAHNDFEFVICDECYNTVDKDVYLSSRDLTKILDQIEQGE